MFLKKPRFAINLSKLPENNEQYTDNNNNSILIV